jgi:acyl-CoA thioesterase-2
MNKPSLKSVLAVTPRDASTFIGESIPGIYNRTFGGQLIGQAVASAGCTVADDRQIVSAQTTFLHPGDYAQPISYRVHTVRDGRTFSNRQVEAHQNGRIIFSGHFAFQVDERLPVPSAAAESERLTPLIQAKPPFVGPTSAVGNDWNYRSYFDIRMTTVAERPAGQLLTEDLPAVTTPELAHQLAWFRLRESAPAPGLLNRAMLGFASDYTVLRVVSQAKGVTRRESGVNGATLSQSIWWHLEPRLDEWLLYVQETTMTPGIRGVVFGRIYTSSGILVASIAQEGFARDGDFDR